MKAFSTILLLLSLAAARPAAAHSPGRYQLPGRPAVRPLTRYLAAVLHLTPRQAAGVQQTLRGRPTRPLSPEDLTLSLNPVLTPEAQLRLQSLQSDVTTYRALYYLAARH